MKVKTDPTIQGMSGRFPKSAVVMMHREGKTITHARAHVMPDNADQQAAFAANIAKAGQLWTAAQQSFKDDFTEYAAQYNQVVVGDNQLPVSGYAIFVKALFAVCQANAITISELTETWGTDVFGATTTAALTTWDCVSHADSGLPTLGFTSGDMTATYSA